MRFECYLIAADWGKKLREAVYSQELIHREKEGEITKKTRQKQLYSIGLCEKEKEKETRIQRLSVKAGNQRENGETGKEELTEISNR